MSKENLTKRVIPNASEGDVQTWMGLSELRDSAQEDFVEEVNLTDLRPHSFQDYVGQSLVKENLEIACGAAKKRSEPLDHLLLHGPPGLGKTSLAKIVARQMEVGFKATSGPVIEKPGDLAAILTSLEVGDVLFIDEIHRLPRVVEEVMYPALEDFQLDILIGQGPSAKSVRIDLKPFTLIGATTRTSLLTSPLRDRFGLVLRLHFYSPEELQEIILRSAKLLGIQIGAHAAEKLGKRSRGTPRIANRLLKRVRDYAQDKADGKITEEVADAALSMLEIDECGLDSMDRLILTTIIDKFQGGPVGIGTIAASIGEDKTTLEEVYEPYLLQEGFLSRTKQGRLVMERAYEHLGYPVNVQAQLRLRS